MANTLQQPEVEPGNGFVSEEAKRIAEQHRTERARKRQELDLQRENILSQRTSAPDFRGSARSRYTRRRRSRSARAAASADFPSIASQAE